MECRLVSLGVIIMFVLGEGRSVFCLLLCEGSFKCKDFARGFSDNWVADEWVPDKTNGHQDKWLPDKWTPRQMGPGQMGQG